MRQVLRGVEAGPLGDLLLLGFSLRNACTGWAHGTDTPNTVCVRYVAFGVVW